MKWAVVAVLAGALLVGCSSSDSQPTATPVPADTVAPTEAPDVKQTAFADTHATFVAAATRTALAFTPTPTTKTLVGVFTLFDDTVKSAGAAPPAKGDKCQGDGGYSDIAPGMQVVISADGKTVAVAEFKNGSVSNFKPDPDVSYSTTQAGGSEWLIECDFFFTIDVPPGHAFYDVKVGRRGDRTYSYADLIAPLTLAYTIGTPF